MAFGLRSILNLVGVLHAREHDQGLADLPRRPTEGREQEKSGQDRQQPARRWRTYADLSPKTADESWKLGGRWAKWRIYADPNVLRADEIEGLDVCVLTVAQWQDLLAHLDFVTVDRYGDQVDLLPAEMGYDSRARYVLPRADGDG